MSATRALGRWAWRTAKKEWRQQLIVSMLLISAVTIAVVANLMAYNLSAPAEAYVRDFELHWYQLTEIAADETDGVAAATIADQLRMVADAGVGPVEQIIEQPVPAATRSGTILLRSQTVPPNNLAAHLSLTKGAWPSGPDEAAITSFASEQLGAAVNETVTIGDSEFLITGFVEDPGALSNQFLLVDESQISNPSTAFLLFNFDDLERLPELSGGGYTFEGPSPQEEASIFSAAATSLALLITALMAVTGFAVLARRRLRQIGILGVVGAGPDYIRRGLVIHGAILGVASAVVGTVLGVGFAMATLPLLESIADRRLSFSVPILAVTAPLLSTLAFSTISAWWPARQFASMSPVDALAGRVPYAERAGKVAPIIGAAMVTVGIAWSVAIEPGSDLISIPLFIAIIGVLLMSSLVALAISRFAPKSFLSMRLASRIARRNTARTTASLAAISLAISLPLSVVLLSASYDRRSNPEFAANVAILSERDSTTDGQIQAATQSTLPQAKLIPMKTSDQIYLTTPDNEQLFLNEAVVGEPDLMEALGIDTTMWETADILLTSDQTYDLTIFASDIAEQPLPEADVRMSQIGVTLAGDKIKAIVNPAYIARKDLLTATNDWLLLNPTAISLQQQIDLQQAGQAIDARVTAAELGEDRTSVRAAAVVAALVLAMVVLTLILTLNRAQDTQRYRTMAAVGASPLTNRAVAAATATMLALGGVALATAIALLVLLSDITFERDETLGSAFAVPTASYFSIVVGTVVFAAALAWLTERQPQALRAESE